MVGTPADSGTSRAVKRVVSDWLSRNWSEIRDGADPEIEELTRSLQLVLCKQSVVLGKKGGEARAKALSKSKRREIAKRAAQKRWED